MAYNDSLPPEGNDYPAPSMKSKLTYHLEGLIPLVLIIIIVLFLGFATGFFNSSTPVIGGLSKFFRLAGDEPASLLIIGNPSPYTMQVLNNNKDLVNPITIKSAEAMSRNPEALLAQYDIVMLDQSNQPNKEVSRVLGEGIQKYVSAGGSFILVMDSGIRRPNAPDILGWKNTFADTVPVECAYIGITNTPSCLARVPVRGRIYPGASGVTHQIMQGIEQVPAVPGSLLSIAVLPVNIAGNEIAYIQDVTTNEFHPAVVEAPTLIGKSIYFNYDPGATPGILESTLNYLK